MVSTHDSECDQYSRTQNMIFFCPEHVQEFDTTAPPPLLKVCKTNPRAEISELFLHRKYVVFPECVQ